MPYMKPEMIESEARRLWIQLEADLYLYLRLVDGLVEYNTLMTEAEDLGIKKSRILASRNRLPIDSYGYPPREKTYWGLRQKANAP
jgi:hypothetical protein